MKAKRRGRPPSLGQKGNTTKNQARGSRKRGKEEMDANQGTVAARSIVQWLFGFTKHTLVAIAQFCNLDYDFVQRWAI